MLEVVKQGTNEYGLWVIGRLTLGNLEIYDLFNVNSKTELDASQPVKIKKLKIRRSQKTNELRFSIEL